MTGKSARIVKLALKGVGALVALVFVVALAWMASNNRWVDDRATSVPDALRLTPASVPEARNSFFAFNALNAPEGLEPHAEGVRRWHVEEASSAELVTPTPYEGSLRWPDRSTDDAVRTAWQCRPTEADCIPRWWAQADGLAAEMARTPIGARCEALVQPDMQFEEVLPTPRAELRVAADSIAARSNPLGPRVSCLRWLHVRAALAARDGEAEAMLGYLRQAELLTQAVLTGSRTLPGVQIANVMARNHWQVITALASRYPGMAKTLAEMIQPLPAAATTPATWMRFEYTFSREMNRELNHWDCAAGVHPPGRLAIWRACAQAAFLLPNATQHHLDRRWGDALALAASDGAVGMVDWAPVAGDDEGPPPIWRNTLGQWLADQGASVYTTYVRRQANLVLQNEAARLALAARDVPAAEGPAWLKQQPMDPRLRERLSFSGGHIVATGWTTGLPNDTARYPIPSGVTIATTQARPTDTPAETDTDIKG